MYFDDQFPIQYIDPVYRPPSEAHSLILPVTNGCSWNKCTFCEMYTDPQKKFSVRSEEIVLQEIQSAGEQVAGVRTCSSVRTLVDYPMSCGYMQRVVVSFSI